MVDVVLQGDALEMLKTLPDESVDCCITSPPYYGLRDYGVEGQIGLEETPELYVQKLVEVFREVKRVLKDDGTLWLNIGDSYWGSGCRGFDFTDVFGEASKIQKGSKGTIDLSNLPKLVGNNGVYKNKDLIGIPWMLAFALRADGWYLRQDIIWHKPNPMPESVKDRCTKSHEYIFLMSKKPHYYFDYEAIQEPSKWGECDPRAGKGRISYDGKRRDGGAQNLAQESFVSITDKRNKRDVWEESTGIRFGGNKYGGNGDKHFQTYSGNEWQGSDKANKRDVWSVTTKAVKEAHFATFPEDLVKPCILAGCRVGGVVLDPFFGSGTTGRVAEALGRRYIGIELNPEYIEISDRRLDNVQTEMQI